MKGRLYRLSIRRREDTGSWQHLDLNVVATDVERAIEKAREQEQSGMQFVVDHVESIAGVDVT